MWTAPGYTPDRPTPPPETGRRLATFARGDGVELRVSLAEYEGRPYIALRVWERGQDGALWPCKGKGCSIRISEASKLAEVLAVVSTAGESAEGQGSGPRREDATRFVDKGRHAREPVDPEKLRGAEPSGGFDEFR